ncbi:hypothetical protein CH300_20020 [Rhodococcus sp. 15-1154-1]|nr:hypothetical protein [Rhodococcus sp. 15-1154-1]OZF00831.1 hypothetical protein CH300_20020 [Rhodococcus sp. 15-1154-1]
MSTDIHSGKQTGAPDLDPQELIEKAFRTATDQARKRTSNRDVTAAEVSEEVIGTLTAHGCMIVTPDVFSPRPVDFSFEAYGVALAELGEDGDTIIALGHVEPRRMIAALSKYWRTYVGVQYDDMFPEVGGARANLTHQITHRWAEFTRNAADYGGHFEFDWQCWPAPAPTGLHTTARERQVAITRWSA